MLISTWTARSLQRRGASSVIPAVPSTATRSGQHNDVQHGVDQRHPVRQHAADAAATRGGGHRGAHSARHALGARHARGARLLERRGRRAHDARHALGACHMRDGRGPSLRINAAAPRGPPPRGPPPLGRGIATAPREHDGRSNIGVCGGLYWSKIVFLVQNGHEGIFQAIWKAAAAFQICPYLKSTHGLEDKKLTDDKDKKRIAGTKVITRCFPDNIKLWPKAVEISSICRTWTYCKKTLDLLRPCPDLQK